MFQRNILHLMPGQLHSSKTLVPTHKSIQHHNPEAYLNIYTIQIIWYHWNMKGSTTFAIIQHHKTNNLLQAINMTKNQHIIRNTLNENGFVWQSNKPKNVKNLCQHEVHSYLNPAAVLTIMWTALAASLHGTHYYEFKHHSLADLALMHQSFSGRVGRILSDNTQKHQPILNTVFPTRYCKAQFYHSSCTNLQVALSCC
jgi:hypothetical protein